jgi:uncharacterized membrane protein YfcA
MTGPTPADPNDGIYRAILMVLVASVFAGAVLALLGDLYFHNEALKLVGVGTVILAGAIYFFFRFLGRREAARRRHDSDGDEGPSSPDPDQP